MGMIDSKATVQTTRKIAGGCEERAVDLNVVLPDYYPPIEAVLKCLLIPRVSSRFQSGDRFSVDGSTTVRLLYVSEDRREVYCYEAAQPFNVSFRCEQAVHHYTSIKVDYVNCRATAPRRVDIHGAFRVLLDGEALTETTVMVDPCEEGLYCQSVEVPFTLPVCEAEKVISIDETVDLGTRVDRMLYSDMALLSSECKVLPNKLIIKGVIRVKALCVQDNRMLPITQDVPFSQILDVDGANDSWQAALEMMQGENETYLQQNDTGNALLFINCKWIACARLMVTKTEAFMLDAYHVTHPSVCETVPIHVAHQSELCAVTSTVVQTVSAPDEVSTLLESWGDLKSFESREENGCVRIDGCLAVHVIAAGEDAHPCYYERALDIAFYPECDGEVVEIQLTDLHVDLIHGELRVKAEFLVASVDVAQHSFNAVCHMVLDDHESFPATDATLRVVFAECGQSVWEIAKSHHACVQDIKAENGFLGDTVSESGMLIIPLS